MKTVIVGLSKGLSDTVESWENSNSFLHRVVWRFLSKHKCKWSVTKGLAGEPIRRVCLTCGKKQINTIHGNWVNT